MTLYEVADITNDYNSSTLKSYLINCFKGCQTV